VAETLFFRKQKMLCALSAENPSWGLSERAFASHVVFTADPPCSIVIEFAKESRPRREPQEDRGSYGYVSSHSSWLRFG
jgi:hypothetical protein